MTHRMYSSSWPTVWGSNTGSRISTWRTKILPCDANHSNLMNPLSRAIGITPARYLDVQQHSVHLCRQAYYFDL